MSNPNEPWRNSKKQRDELRQKYGGHCAYCGVRLDKMQADHLLPCVRITRDCHGRPLPAAECKMYHPERNVMSNMMPACPGCNHHKGGQLLEVWRDILQRSAAILRRDNSTFRAGERIGIIKVTEQPVVFYFERRGADRAEPDA